MLWVNHEITAVVVITTKFKPMGMRNQELSPYHSRSQGCLISVLREKEKFQDFWLDDSTGISVFDSMGSPPDASGVSETSLTC